jgi:hypothetical protein
MIHQITRSEITRNNTNNISCQFVSLIRVVSWIELFTQKIRSRKQEVGGLFHGEPSGREIGHYLLPDIKVSPRNIGLGAGPSAIPAAMDPARSELAELEVTCCLYRLCHHVQNCL